MLQLSEFHRCWAAATAAAAAAAAISVLLLLLLSLLDVQMESRACRFSYYATAACRQMSHAFTQNSTLHAGRHVTAKRSLRAE